MNPSTSDHAFFDETSLYMRLRARFLPGEKLRGYLQWLREQREQADPGGSPPHDYTRKPEDHTESALKKVMIGGVKNSVVVRLDAPERPVKNELTLPLGDTIGALYRASVSLLKDDDFPLRPGGRPFRLLLVSPAMLATLRRYLSEDGSPLALSTDNEKALRQLFGEDVLRTNLEAARVLSAVPELEATFNDHGHGAVEEKVPLGSHNLPRDVIPVVVYDPLAR